MTIIIKMLYTSPLIAMRMEFSLNIINHNVSFHNWIRVNVRWCLMLTRLSETSGIQFPNRHCQIHQSWIGCQFLDLAEVGLQVNWYQISIQNHQENDIFLQWQQSKPPVSVVWSEIVLCNMLMSQLDRFKKAIIKCMPVSFIYFSLGTITGSREFSAGDKQWDLRF